MSNKGSEFRVQGLEFKTLNPEPFFNPEPLSFDIIISGAGPAGSATTLAMQQTGLKIAWVDKSIFPRDKICGDAIPSTVQRVLSKINPSLKPTRY